MQEIDNDINVFTTFLQEILNHPKNSDANQKNIEKEFNELRVRHKKVLFLAYCNISVIPESIGKLTYLERIDLRSNNLQELPESINNLQQLQEIDLSKNEFQNLPESLGQLIKLQELDVSDNKLISLPDSFGNLQQLQKLNLSYNQLFTLPESFGNLQQLQKLELSSNKLSSIPDSFGNLQQLQKLNLSYNQLTTLPESFGNLQQLQEIIIYSNSLSSLPDSFGGLSQLIKLEIYNNQLITLPDSFGELQKLQELYFSKNKLDSLPRSYGNLKQLLLLDLTENQLKSIPEAFGNLKQLKFLSLGNNQLSMLPDTFGELQQLQTLDLEKNQLISLPLSIGHLSQLTECKISQNQLTSLPDSIGNLLQLQRFNLSNNQLSKLPDSIGHLQQLREINLSKNKIITLPHSFSELVELNLIDLSNNKLIDIDNSFFTLSKLTSLDLTNNDLIIKLYQFVNYGNTLNSSDYNDTYFPSKVILLEKAYQSKYSKEDHNDESLAYSSEEDKDQGSVTILLDNDDLEFSKWTDKYPDSVEKLSSYEIHFITNSLSDGIVERELLNLRRDPNISSQKLAERIYAYVKSKNKNSNSDTTKSRIRSYSSNLLPASYFLFGATIITLVSNIIGNTVIHLTGIEIWFLIGLFFFFQFYSGLTVESYVLNIVNKAEFLTFNTGDFLGKRLKSLFLWITNFFYRSLGIMIAIIWLLSIGSLLQQQKALEILNLIGNNDLFLIKSLVLSWISSIQTILAWIDLPDFYPVFFASINYFFEGWVGIFIRVLAMLAVFWSIFTGGWGVLIHPYNKEDRAKGAKLDWYEILALPLGILFAFLTLIVDLSPIKTVPVVVFQVGIALGGIVFFIRHPKVRFQILILIFLLISLFAFSKLGSNLELLLATSGLNIQDLVVKGLVALFCVYIWLLPPIKPYNPDDTIYPLLNDKFSLWYLLGRPMTSGIVNQMPSTIVWKKISSWIRQHPYRPGLFRKTLGGENRRTFVLQYDLGTYLFYTEMNIIIPLVVLLLIIIFLPINSILFIILVGILYNVYANHILPSKINKLMKKSKMSWKNRRFFSDLNFKFERGFTTKISFYGKKIKILPEYIGEFKYLGELNLSECGIDKLPNNLGKLVKLKELDLSKNNLSVIPESMKNLIELKDLNLSSNKLTVLPESIKNLQKLQKLSVYSNKLTTLPDGFGKLQRLQNLDLSRNKFLDAPFAISKLNQLQILDLSNNSLTSLSDVFENLPYLKYLLLSYNELTTLPTSIGKLKQLENINLSNNKFTMVSDSLLKVNNLHTLNLSFNNLNYISKLKNLVNLPSLNRINLIGNDLGTYDASYDKETNEKEFIEFFEFLKEV